MRKTILGVLALALLAGAFYGAKLLMADKGKARPQEQKQVTAVFVDTVKNGTIPVVITSSGNLAARRKVELFAEVQGVFEASDKLFKAGTPYPKGSLLLRLNSDEHRASLQAQKSSLYNQIVLTLPDLRLDYPEAFSKWEQYVRSFRMDGPLMPLPEPATEKEKLFVSGRNFFTLWYNVKNLEERLVKYELRAPFSGILTQGLVNPGTLVRPGQKLGEFLDPSVYELEIPVNLSYVDFLQVGRQVALQDLDHTRKWSGRVARVNNLVNTTTQTVQVFVEVSGANLRDGMYLESHIAARAETGAYELDRKLLQQGDKLFVVQDSLLAFKEVQPVYFSEKTVVVKGLDDGEIIISKPVAGAYPGMRVSVIR